MISDEDLVVQDIESRVMGVRSKERASCESHGEYISYVRKLSSSGCPKCAEEQRSAEEERRAEEKRQVDLLMAKRNLESRQAKSGIPFRYREKTIESFCADSELKQKALAVCKDYSENFREHYDSGRCLIMMGRPGTGKTHLATAIVGNVIANTKATAVYGTVSSIIQDIKGSFDKEAEYTEKQAYERYKNPNLLVIDEVGATKGTEFELSCLFNIINSRYEDGLPTIVVSNLMASELPAALGERAVDRLREGGGIAVVFNWDSERRNIK